MPPPPPLSTAKYRGPRTGMVDRTLAARTTDVYDVREFGAIAAGLGFDPADQSGIQGAINAALSTTYTDEFGVVQSKTPGGIIFFPTGGYGLTSAITFPGGSDAGLVLLGGGKGTVLYMNVPDYILYIGQSSFNNPHRPVSLIQSISFDNSAHVVGGVLTTTERTGGTGGGMGAIYNGSAAPCFSISNCFISCANGIGVFSTSPLTQIQSTYMQGGYSAGNDITPTPPQPFNGIGIIGTSVSLADTRVIAFAVGMNLFKHGCAIKKINMEVCGSGAVVGENLVSYYDPEDNSGDGSSAGVPHPAGVNRLQFGVISGMTLESENPHFGFKITSADCLECDGLTSAHYHTPGASGEHNYKVCDYSIFIGNVNLCTFRNCDFSGSLGIATVAIGQTDATTGRGFQGPFTSGGNVIFDNVKATNTWTSTIWQLPSAAWYGSSTLHNDPVLFRGNPSFDGGVTFANLPPSPSATMPFPIVITDGPFPAWDTSVTPNVSNVGRPITAGWVSGPGPFKVLARWDATLPGWRCQG